MADWEIAAAASETWGDTPFWADPELHPELVAARANHDPSPWYSESDAEGDLKSTAKADGHKLRRVKSVFKKMASIMRALESPNTTARLVWRKLRRSPKPEDSHDSSSCGQDAWAACGVFDYSPQNPPPKPREPPVAVSAYMDSALAIETQLMDSKLFHYDSPEPWNRVHVDYDFGQQLLDEGLVQVKKAIYETFHRRWPAIAQANFACGPRLVRCLNSEISRWLSRTAGPWEPCPVPEHIQHVLLNKINSNSDDRTSDLRNAVCHPEPHSASRYDQLLQLGQRTAVVLEHSECAHAIRALRDQLQDEIQRTVTEIKDNAENLEQPEFDRFWKEHHRALFVQAIADLELAAWQKVEFWGQLPPSKFEQWPEVICAARRWEAYRKEAGEALETGHDFDTN
ncbi:hypothetical protein B0T19DRAFT_442120 [Cercophora scortea]|uniref:Uncharacterized protein n=1 Tax=Cercophora scortea TaxID=314031 RepID=A0AAE0IPN6_9PEZI|nr:hypothetical protein B0T19DRAFT_442120 [Cercophora scortea]